MLTFALIAVAGVLFVFVVLGKPGNISGVAVGSTFLLTTIVTRGPIDRTGNIAVAIMALTLFVAFVKTRTRGASRAPTALLASIYLASLISTLIGYPEGLAALARVSILAILVSLVAARMDALNYRYFLRYLVVTGYVHTAFAAFEAWVGEPIWGYQVRADGSTLFIQANEIFTTEVPRLEGGAGHSITLGVVVSVAVIALVALRGLKWSTAVACAPLLVALAFAGSRSAVLALACVAVVALLSPRNRMSALGRVLAVLIVIGTIPLVTPLVRDVAGTLLESGSFTHRVSGLESALELLDRPLFEVFFGSGYASTGQLYARGYLQDSGFLVVDNQFVTTLATCGLIGLALLVAYLFVGTRGAPPAMLSILIFWSIMAFSFDIMFWIMGATLLVAAAACKPGEPLPADQGEADARLTRAVADRA